MLRLIPVLLFAPLLLAGGCVAPSLKTAHSLDKLEFSGSMSYNGVLTEYDGVLLTDVGDQTTHDPFMSWPGTIFDWELESRLGLGRGFDIGIHGMLVPSYFDVKYSFVDEQRQQTPVSLAIDLEVGIDQLWGPVARAGLLASSNLGAGHKFAIRPAVNVYIMQGGMTYRSQVGDDGTAYGTDEWFILPERSNAWARYKQVGVLVPIGIETAYRMSNKWGIGPYVAFDPWFPIWSEIYEQDCKDCVAGMGDQSPGTGALIVAGIRLTPWFDPEWRH